MIPKSIPKYDFVSMHERACRAIVVLQRQLKEVSKLMGADVSIPLHERKPIPPTPENIRKAAGIIGVSVGWLVTGKPETATDLLVIGHTPTINQITGSAVITDNQHCTIVVDHTAGGA